MENDQRSTTRIKLLIGEVTFDPKDKVSYKIFVMVSMIIFNMAVLLILKYYILPLLFANGTGGFLNKIALKISDILKI